MDPLARIALREQLKRLHSEGVAILISSHILSDLEDICTRIVFIADGKNVSESAKPALPSGALSSLIHCEIEFQGPLDSVGKVAGNISGAQILEKKDGFVLIELPGAAPQASSFLQALLNAGIIVLHFDARGPGLEERYRRAFGERTP